MLVLQHGHVWIRKARRDDGVRRIAVRRGGGSTRGILGFAFPFRRVRIVPLPTLGPIRCISSNDRTYFQWLAEKLHAARQRRVEHVRGWFDVVGFPTIPRDPIDTNFDFGRISKVGLL
jgi:hypothetical protein